MEKALNTVLYVLFAAFGLYFAYNHYEENYVPVPFEQPEAHAAPLFKIGQKATLEEDPWFQAHFATPIPANGGAPEGWSEEEASLDSKACGGCHAEQYAQWEGSAHARAMGSSVEAHLSGASAAELASCQSCHAPMTEQLPTLADGADNAAFLPEHRAQGVSCASCHVRSHARIGPASERSPAEDAPHGGFTAAAQLSSTQACASCHELPTGGPALRDKRLLETVSEWTRTEPASEGQTCQSCHMPEGSHAWRGIEDVAFTQAAVLTDAELITAGGRFEPVRVTLTLTNARVGHRLPTTAQPELRLLVEQLDASGAPIADTRQSGVVGRRLSADGSQELFDTRLLPEESFTLSYSAARHPDAVRAAARIEVAPRASQHSLHGFRLSKGAVSPEPPADPSYVLWERTLELVPPAAAEE